MKLTAQLRVVTKSKVCLDLCPLPHVVGLRGRDSYSLLAVLLSTTVHEY